MAGKLSEYDTGSYDGMHPHRGEKEGGADITKAYGPVEGVAISEIVIGYKRADERQPEADVTLPMIGLSIVVSHLA